MIWGRYECAWEMAPEDAPRGRGAKSKTADGGWQLAMMGAG